MQLASNLVGGGTVNAPDPCLNTWVNFSNMFEAISFSPNVFWTGSPAIFMASVLATSHGDEPDTGLYAPTIGPAFFPAGVPTVLVNGIPAISMLCPSISNAGNAVSGCVAIPSPTNVLLMYSDRERLREVLEGARGPGGGVLLPGEVGYVRIELFSSATPSMVYGAVRDLAEQGMRALIVDLRDNPGGDVMSALELAGDFLEPGALMATLVDADGDETEYRARAGTAWGFPLVVLVNRGTASAAELFAGCLKANGRAVIVGERTYGKGVVQVVAEREGGGVECVSVARCLLPGGVEIEGVGVEPESGGESGAG